MTKQQRIARSRKGARTRWGRAYRAKVQTSNRHGAEADVLKADVLKTAFDAFTSIGATRVTVAFTDGREIEMRVGKR